MQHVIHVAQGVQFPWGTVRGLGRTDYQQCNVVHEGLIMACCMLVVGTGAYALGSAPCRIS